MCELLKFLMDFNCEVRISFPPISARVVIVSRVGGYVSSARYGRDQLAMIKWLNSRLRRWYPHA